MRNKPLLRLYFSWVYLTWGYRLTDHALASAGTSNGQGGFTTVLFFYSHHGMAPANAWTQHMNIKSLPLIIISSSQTCDKGAMVGGFAMLRVSRFVRARSASWCLPLRRGQYLRSLITTDCKTTHYVFMGYLVVAKFTSGWLRLHGNSLTPRR